MDNNKIKELLNGSTIEVCNESYVFLTPSEEIAHLCEADDDTIDRSINEVCANWSVFEYYGEEIEALIKSGELGLYS